MQTTIPHEAAATLRDALTSDVTDLRIEVAAIDSQPFRDNLQREEATLKKVLQQLDGALAASRAVS